MIKKYWPGPKDANDDISYELIENLSTAFSEGKLQALEEMIAIYNDPNLPFDVRMAAGKALAETQHPTALNALSEAVGEAAALDVTFMIGSIELLAQFRDDPRAADAMISAMNKVEEKTNELELSLVKNLNKVRTKDQVMALAAIVQKETAMIDERPMVAGLYLNRLKKGMLLQADSTVIYAKKKAEKLLLAKETQAAKVMKKSQRAKAKVNAKTTARGSKEKAAENLDSEEEVRKRHGKVL